MTQGWRDTQDRRTMMDDKQFDLEAMTHIDEDEIGRRVFYTLTDDASVTKHRTQKLLSHLIERLVDTEVLTRGEVDDMLKHSVL
jgi:hypothetical protein